MQYNVDIDILGTIQRTINMWSYGQRQRFHIVSCYQNCWFPYDNKSQLPIDNFVFTNWFVMLILSLSTANNTIHLDFNLSSFLLDKISTEAVLLPQWKLRPCKIHLKCTYMQFMFAYFFKQSYPNIAYTPIIVSFFSKSE